MRPFAVDPYMHRAIKLMTEGLTKDCSNKTAKKICPFQDLVPFVGLGDPLIWKGKMEYGAETKSMIDPRIFKEKNCTLYGIGIRDDSTFEQQITKHCRQVHAFDCTVGLKDNAVTKKDSAFHPICIGPNSDASKLREIYHTGDGLREQGRSKEMKFQTLLATMDQLNHIRVDYLKFDVEGAEWEIFKTILDLPKNRLPRQIMFELHTEGANPLAVPPDLIKGKSRKQVNRLMIDLVDAGYGLLDLQLNPLDNTCAEVSVVLLTTARGTNNGRRRGYGPQKGAWELTSKYRYHLDWISYGAGSSIVPILQCILSL